MSKQQNRLEGITEEQIREWASPGLFKRAQKKAISLSVPVFLDEKSTTDTFVVDGQTVVLKGRTLDAIQCSCPAFGPCVHKILFAIELIKHAPETSVPSETEVKPSLESTTTQNKEYDNALVHEIKDYIYSLIRLGISHLDEITCQKLVEYSIRLKADQYKVLAGMLNNLAGSVRLYHSEKMSASEIAYAISSIVHECTHPRSDSPVHTSPDCELFFAGCEWWKNPGGAKGLTGFFINTKTGALYCKTIARPAGGDMYFQKKMVFAGESLAGPGQNAFYLGKGIFNASGITLRSENQIVGFSLTKKQETNISIRSWKLLAKEHHMHDSFNPFGHTIKGGLTPYKLFILKGYTMPCYNELENYIAWQVNTKEGMYTLALPNQPEMKQRVEGLFFNVKKLIEAAICRLVHVNGSHIWQIASLLIQNGNHIYPISLDFHYRPYITASLYEYHISRFSIEEHKNIARINSYSGSPAITVIKTFYQHVIHCFECGQFIIHEHKLHDFYELCQQASLDAFINILDSQNKQERDLSSYELVTLLRMLKHYLMYLELRVNQEGHGT